MPSVYSSPGLQPLGLRESCVEADATLDPFGSRIRIQNLLQNGLKNQWKLGPMAIILGL
jgi:hypothetical protein